MKQIYLFCNDNGRRVGISDWNNGHHAGVHDSKVLNPINTELGVHDGIWVIRPSHGARSHNVMQSYGQMSGVAFPVGVTSEADVFTSGENLVREPTPNLLECCRIFCEYTNARR